MQRILPPLDLISAISGDQKNTGDKVRLSHHCLQISCPEGELLYQTMTGELLLLEKGESLSDNRAELIRRRFLVPEGLDEYSFSRQVRQVASAFQGEPGTNNYMIFTTTDCNARCYYCFELNRKRMAMSDRVAKDAAAFIAKSSAGKKVKINWFGGEPLFNRRAIDIISAELRQRQIPFRSTMISNGYLFDEEVVKAAREEWKLQVVQISLDGTEEVYNRSKAYIYREGSAYQRVLRNIELLLDAGIRVEIRLNMNRRNWENLMELVPELKSRFPNRQHLQVYAALLHDFGPANNTFATEQEQIERYTALQSALKEAGLYHPRALNRKLQFQRCAADTDGAYAILPDGGLGKCECESEEHLVGSIYREERDEAELAAWKERLDLPECRDCLFAPTCLDLKQCAWNADGCTQADREIKRLQLTDRVLTSYLNAKSGKDKVETPEESAGPEYN